MNKAWLGLLLSTLVVGCADSPAVGPTHDAGSDFGIQLQDGAPGGEVVWLHDGPPPDGWSQPQADTTTQDVGPESDTAARDSQPGADLVLAQGLIESITAYGSYYNFNADLDHAPWPSNGSDLTSVPRFASGPCMGRAAGACRVDTRAIVTLDGVLVETITAYGKGYNFDMSNNNQPWAENGMDLTTVPRFAAGPCLGKAVGTCRFDTRLFVELNGVLIESITAYGKAYNFDVNDNYRAGPQNGADLTTVPRFAAGPCLGKAAGTCTFDTRVFVELNGVLIESITAYGKGYNFDVDNNNQPLAENGADLTTVPRFASGPCAGKAPGSCVLGTRAFVRF